MNTNEIMFRVIEFDDCYSIEKVKFDSEGNITAHTDTKSIASVKKGDFIDPISSLLPIASQIMRASKLPIESAIKGAKKDASKKNNVRPQKTSGSDSKK